MKQLLNNFKNRVIAARWNIGIADLSNDYELSNIRYLKGGGDFLEYWFADPFLVDENEESFEIICEEMVCSKGKGRIVRLTVHKKDFCLVHKESILDLKTHLSFPYPLRVNGNLYIFPENGQSGQQRSYQYNGKLTFSSTLVEDSIYDPVIFQADGVWWMLATSAPDANGCVLNVYRSDNPLEGYNLSQTISFNDNIARRAGCVFYDAKGRLISPAQVCNNYYGEGISLQEIKVDRGEIAIKEIKRISPFGNMLSPGFHTFNVFSGGKQVIIDGYGYGSRFFHDLYFCVRGLKNK